MVCCCAVGCSNRTEKGFRTYNFPTEKRRRAQWTSNVNRDNWEPSRSSRLCEVHFELDHFELGRKDGKKLLKPYAVPTLFGKNVRKTKLPDDLPKPISVKTERPGVVASHHDHCYKQTRTSPQNSPSKGECDDTVGVTDGTTEETDSIVDYYVYDDNIGIEIKNENSMTRTINDSGDSSSDISRTTLSEDVTVSTQQNLRTYTRKPNQDKFSAVPCDGTCIETIRMLKIANNNLTKQLTKEREKAVVRETNLKRIFNEDQLEALSWQAPHKWKHIRWKEDTLQKCWEMKCILGQKAYDFLRVSGFPLPSVQTIIRSVDKLQYEAETLTAELGSSSGEESLESSLGVEEVDICWS